MRLLRSQISSHSDLISFPYLILISFFLLCSGMVMEFVYLGLRLGVSIGPFLGRRHDE